MNVVKANGKPLLQGKSITGFEMILEKLSWVSMEL